MALHYLCRPQALSDLCPKLFFEQYEVIRGSSNGDDELFDFEDNRHFTHPAQVNRREDGEISRFQVIRERKIPRLAWVPNHCLVLDAAKFDGTDILTCENITEEMEDYALHIFALCHSYICVDDLKLNDSFVLKLRQLFEAGHLDDHVQYLQNMQDARGNYMRVTPTEDDLQACSIPFQYDDEDDGIDENTKKSGNDLPPEEEEQLQSLLLQGQKLDIFLSLIEDDLQAFDPTQGVNSNSFQENFVPSSISFKSVQLRGSYRCGTDQLCNLPYQYSDQATSPFLPLDSTDAVDLDGNNVDEDELNIMEMPPIPSPTDIVHVLLQRNCLSPERSIQVMASSKRLAEANGSALSICAWAEKTGLDSEQRRAFEVFAGSFVLSFFNDANETTTPGPQLPRTRNRVFLKEKVRLLKLCGKLPVRATQQRMCDMNHKNLVCFLHGPGGSGKSAVLELLQLYAREYCNHLNYEYNSETIVVTAMSGVTATLIGERTTHSAAHLNKKASKIPYEDKFRWKHTRLLIVDEISFASKSEIKTLDAHVKLVKDAPFKDYGGIDVIFCGDMRQLQPGGGKVKIYECEFPEFHGMINCYLELNAMHRFSNDVMWGELLCRFHNGKLTEDDMDTINTRVVDQNGLSLPNDIRYVSYRNIDRVSINTGLFLKHLQSAPDQSYIENNCVLVLSSCLKIKEGDCQYRSPSNAWETYLWQSCGEGQCKPSGFSGRFDPAMLLFYNRPVLVNNNKNVEKMIANGTRAFLQTIHLKPDETYTMCTVDSIAVPTVRADQILKVELHFESPNATGNTFKIAPKEHTFIADVPYPRSLQTGSNQDTTQQLHMKGLQLPFICNNATTGHKLQGASVQTLFVHTRSMVENWSYVVLSRVKTISGWMVSGPRPIVPEKRLLYRN